MAIGRTVPEHAFADARPLAGRLPVKPTALTPNLSPAAAHRSNVPIPAHTLHATAGPRISLLSPGAHSVTELRHVVPPPNIHPASTALRPGTIAAPHSPGEAPRLVDHGLPVLRAPAARPGTLSRPGAPSDHVQKAGRAEARQSIPEPRTGVRHETPQVLLSHDHAQPTAHTEAPRPAVHEPASREDRPQAAKTEAHPATRSATIHREVPRPEAKTEPHAPARKEVNPARHVEATHSDEKHPPHR
jgi:hypothetical protein